MNKRLLVIRDVCSGHILMYELSAEIHFLNRSFHFGCILSDTEVGKMHGFAKLKRYVSLAKNNVQFIHLRLVQTISSS